MSKIREILRLAACAKLSQRQIALALNVSRPVVAQYLKDFKASGASYEDIAVMADSELLKLLIRQRETACPRYQHLAKLFSEFTKELKKTGVTKHLLWLEYREEQPAGYSYSQFCYHYQVWCHESQLSMHIDHKAGDKLFVDFAGDRFIIYDPDTGEEQAVDVFVATLGASQLTYVEARPGQTTEDWVCATRHALEYFGGVPRAIVPDNATAVVAKVDRYEPGMTPMFDEFARHYQTVIMPARVRHPKDKSLAENAVRLTYQRIYAPLRDHRFHSVEELNAAIRERLETHNRTPFQRLDYSRRELFEAIEQGILSPLPTGRFEIKHSLTRKVQFNYHVELHEDRHYYSVPWQLRGKTVKLLYDERTVAIYYDNIRVAFHQRDTRPNGYSTVHTHMPEQHRSYAEWNPERLQSWARSIGEPVEVVVRKVLESRPYPEQAYKTCMGILNLVKTYGPERLKNACRHADSFQLYSYRRIKNILEQGVENAYQTSRALEDKPLAAHANIRGKDYYN